MAANLDRAAVRGANIRDQHERQTRALDIQAVASEHARTVPSGPMTICEAGSILTLEFVRRSCGQVPDRSIGHHRHLHIPGKVHDPLDQCRREP
jgi:hypothetical protein